MEKFSSYLSKIQEDAATLATQNKAREMAAIDNRIESLKQRMEPLKTKIETKQEEIAKLKASLEPMNDALAALYKKKADKGGLIP